MSKERNNLNGLVGRINDKYGAGTIIKGSDYPNLPRISTGIFSLDVEIGGGIPKGRMVIFKGNESTSKTTTAKMAVVQFQKTCRVCMSEMEIDDEGNKVCPTCEDGGVPHKAFFTDVEGTFDPVWFKKLGGDLDELELFQPEYTEQACDVVEAVIRTGDVDIIVVDSIAMMSPAEEIEKSSEDSMIGVHARLTNRLVRSISSGMNHLGMTNVRKPSVILINQLRDKVGVMFGSPETMPGGRGQNFAASITVKFFARPSERVYDEGGEKKPVGQQIRFNVEKNKTFPPHRSGIFTLFTDGTKQYGRRKGEVDNDVQVIKYGILYGLIDKKGGWYSYENIKKQGEQKMIEALLEEGLLDEIKDKLVGRIKDV